MGTLGSSFGQIAMPLLNSGSRRMIGLSSVDARSLDCHDYWLTNRQSVMHQLRGRRTHVRGLVSKLTTCVVDFFAVE
jgi:hypothetical protein